MYNRTTLYGALIPIFSILLYAGTANAQPRKFSFSRNKMGSPFNLIMVCNDSVTANRLAERCFALVDSFNHIFSDYDSTSELTGVNNAAGSNKEIAVSPALQDIIFRSRFAYQQSAGAFDITVGALSQVWRSARKQKQFPSIQTINNAKHQTGFQKIHINSSGKKLRLPKSMRLDLGGIAKGYVAQQVIDFLHRQGIHQALADAGGDIAMSGAPPGSAGWVVGINVPETTEELLQKKLQLHDMAVATSGDAYQYFEHDAKKYSHIIDPRTGYGITSQRNVTVIANDGATADWLATACSILPIESAKKLAMRNNAALLITELVGNKVIFHMTERFAHYWKK